MKHVTRRSLLILALAGAVVSSASPLRAQFLPLEARCRHGLQARVQNLFRVVMARQVSCHRARMLGRLGERVDCNDPERLPSQEIISLVESHLRRWALNSCRGRPADLGFDTCPDPCGGIPIRNYYNVGECLGCLAKNEAQRVTTALYGTPPVFSRNVQEVRCQGRVGLEAGQYAVRRLKTQRRCQYLQDRGAVGYGVDCRTADLFGAVGVGSARVRRALGVQCPVTVTVNLNSCGGDAGAEIACVIEEVEESTRVLFDAIYGALTSSPVKFTFITSSTYTGAELGGLDGADQICQLASEVSGRPLPEGVYKAWLSDGSGSPDTRFTKARVPYLRADNQTVALNYSELVTNHPLGSISVDENGNVVPIESPVWTGTQPSGAAADSGAAAANCDGWTNAEGTGVIGLHYFIGGGIWTQSRAVNCARSAHLYCFQQ